MLDFKFDVIGITETKLSKNSPPKFDINLTGYKCFHVDTEAAKGGSLIYVYKILLIQKKDTISNHYSISQKY